MQIFSLQTAIGYKNFRLFAAIRFICSLAGQQQSVALGFYIYSVTHNTLSLAAMGLAEAVPAIGMAIFGGYIADRFNRKTVLLATLVCQLFAGCGMLAFTARHAVLPAIYAMLFCSGVARAFYQPAMFGISSAVVPAELYADAVNWATISWQTANIAGPVICGVLYAVSGTPGLTFTVNICLLLTAVMLAYRLQSCPPAPEQPTETVLNNLIAGVRFVIRTKMMLYAMALDLCAVLFGGVTALLPVYAADILKTGAAGLGFMRTAPALGAAVAMALMVKFPATGKPWRNLLWSVAGFGLSVVMFGISHSYFLCLLFLFAQGFFDSVSVVIRGTLMQLLTPDALRGRVAAVNSIFISSSAEIGDVESGIAARLLGTVAAVLAGGCITLAVMAVTWLKTREQAKLTMLDIMQQTDPG